MFYDIQYKVHDFQSSIRPDRVAQLVEHRSSNSKVPAGFETQSRWAEFSASLRTVWKL